MQWAEQEHMLVKSVSSLPFPQVAWRRSPCTPTGSTCEGWWAASRTSRCLPTTTSPWWRMQLTGRTSTRVGPSDKRGALELRTHPVLVCAAESELAATALHSRTTVTIRRWQSQRETLRKRTFSLSFPLLTKPNWVFCVGAVPFTRCVSSEC